MAGDWIKWTKGLAKRREVVVMSSRLNRDRHEIAGRLMELWEWCDDNIAVTDVPEMSPDVSLVLGDKPFEFVDALLGLPGMAEAMSSPDVRWLEARSGGRVVFPNLARHNGTSAKTRAYEATKKAKQRSKRQATTEDVPGSVPKMSPKNGDQRREEKRREEELNTHSHPPIQVALLGESAPKRLQKSPMAESFPNECAAIHGIEIDGDVVMYSADPLRWEAAFICWWNNLPGVSKRSTMSLDTSQRRKLRDRLSEGDWFWKRTQAAFPLWTPTTWNPTIGKFLDPDTVTDILDGKYREQKRRATMSETNEPVMFTEQDLEDE